MPLFTEVSGDYAQMGKNVQRRSGMPIPIDFAGSDVSFLHLKINLLDLFKLQTPHLFNKVDGGYVVVVFNK